MVPRSYKFSMGSSKPTNNNQSTIFYIMFKKQARVLYLDLKHEAEAECFGSDKARTASF